MTAFTSTTSAAVAVAATTAVRHRHREKTECDVNTKKGDHIMNEAQKHNNQRN